VIDGNDNVWISNFAMPNSPITELCGVRTENCPPGFKTGQQIAPPGGYVGGGLQMQTDLAIGPAGDVWVINNWQDIDSCFGTPDEALSTRCGGQGVVIFSGMAKPVRPPQIGPARPLQRAYRVADACGAAVVWVGLLLGVGVAFGVGTCALYSRTRLLKVSAM